MKTEWIKSLNTIANQIETQALEAEETGDDTGTALSEAVSYIRLAIDELNDA